MHAPFKRISLIGAPTDIGAGSRGASMGPEALRVAGLQAALEAHGLQVHDRGNLTGPANPWLPPQHGYRHLDEVVAWNHSVHDAVLLPRPKRKTPILIGGNGPKRSLPLAAKYADEWNGVFVDADTYRTLNKRLTELLEKNGRDPKSVKRSLMGPFAWAQGDGGIERLEAYIDAGCERFMLQFTEYDNLEPIEAWAADNLKRFL